MFKLTIFILFYSLFGYSQNFDNAKNPAFSSSIEYTQKININHPKNITFEFTLNNIIIKAKGYSDIVYNIISKSIEHNFDVYQLNHNAKIIHAKNYPTYNNGYIEIILFNETTKQNDTINFIYNKYK